MTAIARWKRWDVVALTSGAVPLILILIAAYTEIKPFGDFSGHVMIGSALLYLVASAFAWKHGDGRLIAGGCAMLIVPAVISFPLIMLFVACLAGNCI